MTRQVQVPKIGDRMTVRGIECEIFKVHFPGTVDVVALDNSGAWRVTGLPFLKIDR